MMIARPDFARNDLGDKNVQIRAMGTLILRAPQTATSTLSDVGPSILPFSTSDQSSGGHGLGKSVLEYIFLGVAVVLILTIIFRRVRGLKPANQSYWSFFVSRGDRSQRGQNRLPRTHASPINRDRLPHSPYPDTYLAGLPAAYQGHSNRRTQAQDVDARGRRMGNRAEVDHDGALDDKDILPAYDVYGGPPKYVEAGLISRLSGVQDTSHPPVEESSNRPSEGYANIPPETTHTVDVDHDQPSRNPPPPNLACGRLPTTNEACGAGVEGPS